MSSSTASRSPRLPAASSDPTAWSPRLASRFAGRSRQHGQLLNRPQTLVSKFIITYQTSGTRTNPASETESTGLHRLRVAASAEQSRPNCYLSWFLQCYIDRFIVTGQLPPVYWDWKKSHQRPPKVIGADDNLLFL